jgi:two-component system, response regulator RegA
MLKDSGHTLLIVDGEVQLLQSLSRAMKARGFEVKTATSIADALTLIGSNAPSFAMVDVRLDDGCGLEIVKVLKLRRSDARAIILTGYGNIATAVRAVKVGATDYFTKPADADELASALLAPTGCKAEAPMHPMSANRVRWEHIQSMHELCSCNVSETARRLRMHRRTLQRILSKPAPL